MTAIAKLLVLLNAFAAVAVCSWALATSLNRIDPDAAVDASGEKLMAKIKRLNDEARQAKDLFPGKWGDIDIAEIDLAQTRSRIKLRLDQALTGSFVKNPLPSGRIDLIPNPTPDLSPAISGLDGKPLLGRKQLEKELDEAVRRASDASREIENFAKLQADIGPRINTEDARAARLKTIYLAHLDELLYLTDERINWESRTVSLIRRRDQLLTRLQELKTGVQTSIRK